MIPNAILHDLVVLEWGRRPAVRACGGLLAQLGATVLAFPADAGGGALGRFKTGLSDTPAERARALARAQVVLFSSDRADEPPLPPRPDRPERIEVDLRVDATGRHGAWTEPLLQAMAGIAGVTGASDTPPVICAAPVIELQAAIFAAAGALAAWPRLVAAGEGQRVVLGLIDCALNGLSSVLPLVYAGKTPRRAGNRHPMAVPWNSYQASDGWVLLCSATDEHWVRLCALMGRPELADGRFARLTDRVEQCDAVDAEVSAWTATLTMAECVAALKGAGLAAGPILALSDLPHDPNLIHRRSISGGRPAPLSFLKTAAAGAAATPPAAAAAAPAAAPAARALPARPLAGLRVIEIGQYTTAPLAAKQLALLGAEVIKIEPPGGEASRAWPPHRDGQGYFYTMNNANKRSAVLDLRQEQDRATFAGLLRASDVLVENMKPGSLDRLGFGTQRLAALNPRLIHCAISGFGRESAYPGRPAFDTVIQAMSGLMDATKAGGTPFKLGISAADIAGGIAGLFAVLVGLEQRRRTGRGVAIDLSMQDVAVWLTQSLWDGSPAAPHAVLACDDGEVVAAAAAATARGILGSAPLSRDAAIARLEGAGIATAPVRTINEIAAQESVAGGSIHIDVDARGQAWPLFACPYRFSREETVPLAAIGMLGEADEYVCRLGAGVGEEQASPGVPVAVRS